MKPIQYNAALAITGAAIRGSSREKLYQEWIWSFQGNGNGIGNYDFFKTNYKPSIYSILPPPLGVHREQET